jgi:histidine triad (HIT) family protein
MSKITTVECFVCRKHRGEVIIPGGVIFEIDLIYISHAQLGGKEKDHYLGHVFVEPKRHVAGLADLTEEEAQAIGLYTSLVAKALLCTEDMEHIYTYVIGNHVQHVHVISRYVGAPRE